MTTTDNISLLTVSDVAKILHFRKDTIRIWCKKGIIPSSKLGREYRINKQEFYEWYTNREGKNVQ